MKKWPTLLVLLAAWPLLTAGGGINPPPPSNTKLVPPMVHATVVVDTHDPFNFPGRMTAGQVGLRVQKGNSIAASTFDIPGFYNFSKGCLLSTAGTEFEGQGPSLTAVRFVGPLWWVPTDVQQTIFGQLGITISGTNAPEVTDVANDFCTPNTPGDTSGILSFDAIIQFRVPR